MIKAPGSPRVWSLLSQLQRQCYLGRQLMSTCRHASTTTQARPAPSNEGFKQSKSQHSSPRAPPPGNNDDVFLPKPLDRPLGMSEPPEAGQNSGIDLRTLRQRRNDFVDYDKHLERRRTMTRQIARPYYRDWKNLRHAKGKLWIAPTKLFRADKALYFPNLQGTTLASPYDARDTTEILADRISVLSLYSGSWAMAQAGTFLCENEELEEMVKQGRAGRTPLQKVVLNVEQNSMKAWLVKLFMGSIRRNFPEEEHGTYFLVRRGLGDELKESIGMLNSAIGYTYLLDHECRIRWAASADAHADERASLTRGAARLVQEYRRTLGEEHWRHNGFDTALPSNLVSG